MLVGWLVFRDGTHLLFLAKEMKLDFTLGIDPRLSRGSPLHYCCVSPAPINK